LVDDHLRKTWPTEYQDSKATTRPDITDTLAGLHSVRNRIGHEVDFVDYVEMVGARPDLGDGRVTAWSWRSVREPTRNNDR
jgi:hypothetical protein